MLGQGQNPSRTLGPAPVCLCHVPPPPTAQAPPHKGGAFPRIGGGSSICNSSISKWRDLARPVAPGLPPSACSPDAPGRGPRTWGPGLPGDHVGAEAAPGNSGATGRHPALILALDPVSLPLSKFQNGAFVFLNSLAGPGSLRGAKLRLQPASSSLQRLGLLGCPPPGTSPALRGPRRAAALREGGGCPSPGAGPDAPLLSVRQAILRFCVLIP